MSCGHKSSGLAGPQSIQFYRYSFAIPEPPGPSPPDLCTGPLSSPSSAASASSGVPGTAWCMQVFRMTTL